MPFGEPLMHHANCSSFSDAIFHGFSGHQGWFQGFHFPFGMLGLILLVAGTIWLLSRRRESVCQEAPDVSALELLQRRYASGRIDREEYLRRRTDLNS